MNPSNTIHDILNTWDSIFSIAQLCRKVKTWCPSLCCILSWGQIPMPLKSVRPIDTQKQTLTLPLQFTYACLHEAVLNLLCVCVCVRFTSLSSWHLAVVYVIEGGTHRQKGRETKPPIANLIALQSDNKRG